MACSIGPVLAEADAVASKVATVFSRGYARDHLDLAGILASGRNSRDQLMAMAKAVDAGFTTGWFAERLPHLLTIDQLVERLGTSTRHIRRLIAERRIPISQSMSMLQIRRSVETATCAQSCSQQTDAPL